MGIFVIDSVLTSSTPKICISNAVLQMLCRGQNCEFNHIESRGENIVTSVIKPQSAFFFSTHGAYLYSVNITFLFSKIIQNRRPNCTFLTHPI